MRFSSRPLSRSSLSRSPLSRTLTTIRAGALAAAIGLAGTAALAQDAAVVANVDGHAITEADLELALAELEPQLGHLPVPQRRAAALSTLLEIRLLSAAAEARQLDQSDDFTRRMEFLRGRALHSAYIDAEVAPRVTDEALRARYDTEIAAIEPVEEVRARHIIVASREEAAAVIAELDAGGDFEALARERSTDGAASEGGDLGYFGPGQMVPAFEEAALALEVGSHSSEPVETQFGWHVIKLEDRRRQQLPAFEEVQQQLRSLLLRETYLEAVDGLRADAEIEIEDPEIAALLEQAEDGEE